MHQQVAGRAKFEQIFKHITLLWHSRASATQSSLGQDQSKKNVGCCFGAVFGTWWVAHLNRPVALQGTQVELVVPATNQKMQADTSLRLVDVKHTT